MLFAICTMCEFTGHYVMHIPQHDKRLRCFHINTSEATRPRRGVALHHSLPVPEFLERRAPSRPGPIPATTERGPPQVFLPVFISTFASTTARSAFSASPLKRVTWHNTGKYCMRWHGHTRPEISEFFCCEHANANACGA
jgi:hypothetical protein